MVTEAMVMCVTTKVKIKTCQPVAPTNPSANQATRLSQINDKLFISSTLSEQK